MNTKHILSLIAIAVVVGGAFLWQGASPAPSKEKITVYKTPECGCCSVYATYLSRAGMETDAVNVSQQQLQETKQSRGIPQHLSSCHTSIVAGYVVEGHVPLVAVEKLLAEKPDIAGIGLAGMPEGSPGMPGSKTEDWVVYALGKDGKAWVFMTL
jgi:hypothetical protein